MSSSFLRRNRSARWLAGAVSGLGAALALVLPVPSQAQQAPTASESAAYTGLHLAASKGDLAMLERLLTGGADTEARDSAGRTPLHVATFARQREAIRRLAAGKADLNAMERQRYDAVTIASVADDPETLALLLKLGASARQTTSPYDGTALIAAAHLGHVEVVRQLIAAGAPLDHVNNLHWTALIESIVLGDGGPRHQETLDLLVNAGANLRLADAQGRTPIELARSRGYTRMVTRLQAAGAK